MNDDLSSSKGRSIQGTYLILKVAIFNPGMTGEARTSLTDDESRKRPADTAIMSILMTEFFMIQMRYDTYCTGKEGSEVKVLELLYDSMLMIT